MKLNNTVYSSSNQVRWKYSEVGGKEYQGSGGQKSPSGVQGQSPSRGLGDEVPQKLSIFAYMHLKF